MAEQLTDPNEVLFRQIHPSNFKDGRPASDRFRPQPSDHGKMSVDRAALTSANASHALYSSSGNLSAAVFGVSVEEFLEESLICLSDPLIATAGQPANPAHALVDYTSFEERKWKNISKRLCIKAIERGQLHPPDED
ncbi:hypothetical protein [Altererythrobacter sp. Root672]|uniref:hypothetical protein n=1 Tax=Altererythrobacter sp. Root672 TaxID=1736584 RepID=UPI0006F948CD|nr:hypothetical protein [Altererythrobacter sp. Root672]KRA84228.1 hypothetical protein ASD76_09655 [Altererythrobacter sp. Root672]